MMSSLCARCAAPTPILMLLGMTWAALTAVDAPPTIATPAAATPAVVISKTTVLSVVGADDGGAAALRYAWLATGPAAVAFSATGTNAAKTVTATFTVPGDYACLATVTDAAGQTVTSSVAVQVVSTLASLAISPTSAVVNPGLSKAFAGTAKDQFGVVMPASPLTWSSTSVSGTDGVDQSGLFTAGSTPGAASVTVTSGAKTATATIRVNAAPTAALAPVDPVVGKTAALVATGADVDDAATTLTYTWSATGPKSVSFSSSGYNASRNSTATFSGVGTYAITVTVKDPAGLTAQATQAVTVLATPTTVVVAPNAATTVVNPGATKAFTATVKDQFVAAIAGVPVTWAATPATVGSIGNDGVFLAGQPGQATVTAVAGAASGSAPVRVNLAPTAALAAVDPVVGKTAALVATGADADDAATTLTYTWSATGPKSVSFSSSGYNASRTSTATFSGVGTYAITVTVKDPAGLTAQATQVVTVLATPTTLVVAPNAATTVVNPGATKAFTATVKDQFTTAIAGVPVTWTVAPDTAGTISATGVLTGGTPGQATVSATAGGLVGVAPVRVNAAPTVSLAAPAPIAGTTATFVATGADADDLATTWKYYWSAQGPRSVVFSPSGTAASATTTATFTAVGTYTITVKLVDPYGLSATSVQTQVVEATDVGAVATPSALVALTGETKVITVAAVDQFGATTERAIVASSAVGGTLTTSGSVATFVAGFGTAPGSITLTVDTVPQRTLEIPVQFIAYAGQGTGLSATYFDNADFTGKTSSRIDPEINFGLAQWPEETPVPGFDREWWSAIWTGDIDIPTTDTYTFATLSDDGVVVMIDGQPIIENWTGHAITRDQATITLTAGKHPIQVRYYNSRYDANLELFWSSPAIPETHVPQVALYPGHPTPSVATGTGLCATYYDEDQFAGFTSVKLDPQLDMIWDAQTAPAMSIAPDAWSVRWVGQIEAPYTDNYTFAAVTNHPFTLAINAMPVITNVTDGPEHTATGTIYLQAGRRYDLVATYRATTMPARLALSWSGALLGGTAAVSSLQFYPVDEQQAVQVQVQTPLASYTSPAWIEGLVGHWTTALSASVNGAPVTVARAGAAPWHLTTSAGNLPPGVPLAGTSNTVVLDSTNGATLNHVEQVITWTTIDLAHRPYDLNEIDVRPGDSLRLTATGAGSVLELCPAPVGEAAFAATSTGTPGQEFVVPFHQSGVFVVTARIDGVEVGRLTVRVPSVDLVAPIACHINYRRIKDISAVDHGAGVAFVPNDSAQLDVGLQSSTDTTRRLTLRPLQSGSMTLQARLGINGPMLSECPVDNFTIRSTAEKHITLVDILPDGKRVLEGTLIMSPVVKNLDVRLSIYTGGITFDDSTLVKLVSSNDFICNGVDGELTFRIIQCPWAHTCHSVDVFQSSVQISGR